MAAIALIAAVGGGSFLPGSAEQVGDPSLFDVDPPAPFHLGAQAQWSFREHVVATGLRGGYQVIAVDLNRDDRPDLIALASGLDELVWYENPRWERHVLATGLSGMINVAAHDLDGDGVAASVRRCRGRSRYGERATAPRCEAPTLVRQCEARATARRC